MAGRARTPPAQAEARIPISDSGALALITNRPPFVFKGVTMRIFPVRANMATLRDFCDQYLNFVPAEVACYQPSAPFVYICMISYGRMHQVQDVGWVAQDEIAFTVPLQWYQEKNGRRVFRDFASFSPFIFVDIEMSEITGREVYGWPKEYAVLSSEIQSWARNPRAPQNLLTVATRRRDPDAVQGWSQATLLEVLHRPPASFSLFPPQATNPLNPFAALARAAWGSWFWWRNAGDMLGASPARGFSPTSPSDLMQMAADIAGKTGALALAPFLGPAAAQRGLGAQTMNLKQFHAAGAPGQACYQALVNAEMRLQRFNRSGLLGDLSLLGGDPSGGFRLRLHRRRAGNIIDALGIEEEAEDRTGGGAFFEMRPFLPFWIDVDVHYGEGRPLAWRVLGEEPPTSGVKLAQWQHWRLPSSARTIPPSGSDRGEFRDARQVAWEALETPYETSGSSLRVLPLFCERTEKLQEFCDGYLNEPLPTARPAGYFQPWGQHVFLLAKSYRSITDANGGVVPAVVRELAFAVPVLWKWGDRTQREDDDPVIDVGLTYPFYFTDNEVASILFRERMGLPVLRASLDSPETLWMETLRPEFTGAKLLLLRTELLGAFYPGEHATERELLRIELSTVMPLAMLRPTDLDELDKAVEQAAGLLDGSAAFSRFTMKQYPGAGGPPFACYQSLVRAPFASAGKLELTEFRGSLKVAIARYPSLPIVERLGLEVNSSVKEGGRQVDYLAPHRSFFVSGDFRYGMPTGLCWRGEGVGWRGRLQAPPETGGVLDFDPAVVSPQHVIFELLARRREGAE